jgi:hypothetical protein
LGESRRPGKKIISRLRAKTVRAGLSLILRPPFRHVVFTTTSSRGMSDIALAGGENAYAGSQNQPDEIRRAT